MKTANECPDRRLDLKIGDRVRWFLGPRKLVRTGEVLSIDRATGNLQVKVDGLKTTPIRTVTPTTQYEKMA